jgi:hypothetical protein
MPIEADACARVFHVKHAADARPTPGAPGSTRNHLLPGAARRHQTSVSRETVPGLMRPIDDPLLERLLARPWRADAASTAAVQATPPRRRPSVSRETVPGLMRPIDMLAERLQGFRHGAAPDRR